MALWVRERPPLRLSISVAPPAGGNFRWGNDDPHSANVPDALTFASAIPGGFSTMSCTLNRDPRRSYPDLEELSNVTIYGLGGAKVAWQGRLEQLPDTGGSQSQVNPQCNGYQSALDDNSSAAMIYIDQDLTKWQGPSLDRQILLASSVSPVWQVGSSQVQVDSANNLPRLDQQITDNWVSPNAPRVESWYDSGLAQPIASVYYDASFRSTLGGNTNFSATLSFTPDDAGLTINGATGNLYTVGGTEQTGTAIPTTPSRFVFLTFAYAATPAGASGAQYDTYWKLAVYGNHGLPLQGAAPGGFLASDIVQHALSTWVPEVGFTTGTNGSIQVSKFVIPQLTFTTPTTASNIIKQAAQFELLDWAVWEGPLFWLSPRGKLGSMRAWTSRVGEAQLQQTGPNVSRIYNNVLVQFTGVDGISYTAGPPGTNANYTSITLNDPDPLNPANEAGINRTALLTMGTSTAAAAIQVGGIFLQEQKDVDRSGQASLIGTVQDTNGVLWPSWAVRAGDTIAFLDSNDPSPRRVVSTSYEDSTATNAVQLDAPPDGLQALLERMSVVISPLGLS